MEVSARYDNLAGCKAQFVQSQNSAAGYQTTDVCSVRLGPLPRDASPPIFVYYEIANMYMNHRRYGVFFQNVRVEPKNSHAPPSQHGAEPQRQPTTRRGCSRYRDGHMRSTGAVRRQRCVSFSIFDLDVEGDGAREDVNFCDALTRHNALARPPGSQLINPCGLAAWSYFNDSYSLARADGTALSVSADGIAYSVDHDKRFASTAPATFFNADPATRGGGQLSNNGVGGVHADERFIVWMRTPALPTFRKLWGRIDGVTLQKGEYIDVLVDNNWNSYGFGGAKRVVLSTSSWLGGANDFMGIAYIVVGCVCLALGMFFTVLVALKGRRPGDPRFLSWNKAAAARAVAATQVAPR